MDDLLTWYWTYHEMGSDIGRYLYDPTSSIRLLTVVERFSPLESPRL
jgi:hypothetical protein